MTGFEPQTSDIKSNLVTKLFSVYLFILVFPRSVSSLYFYQSFFCRLSKLLQIKIHWMIGR